ncbi:MAG: acetoin utilization protein AcuC, partial [Aeromicrobium sp.]
MSSRACVVFDENLINYNFGNSHPMAPVRIDLTMQLATELGVMDGVDVVGATPADDDLLASIHAPAYIEGVHKLSDHPIYAEPKFGLGTEDNPVFAHMHEASALIAGASVEAA